MPNQSAAANVHPITRIGGTEKRRFGLVELLPPPMHLGEVGQRHGKARIVGLKQPFLNLERFAIGGFRFIQPIKIN